MISRKTLLVAASALLLTANAARADLKVVTSIKPVHSLVSAVMEGVGTPDLIVTGAGSPHNHALKPSQASLLANAGLVFWVGHEMEAFLEKPVATIGEKAKSIELFDSPGLRKLEQREGGAFQAHDHKEKGGHNHNHEEHDLHFWLDPENAKLMTVMIADTLTAADPGNADQYQTNSMAMLDRLDTLIRETSTELAPVKDGSFIVFHDAYQYFEARFGLSAAGSITVNPEVMPGAERVREIRQKLKKNNVQCVFSEPQFEPKLIEVVTEGTETKPGVLDPLGATLEDGPDLYFTLIRNMAQSFRQCLSKSS
ncbi:MAG: zinc ABC transporter substrate-binding protein ZnuA [Anderseniella sp.]